VGHPIHRSVVVAVGFSSRFVIPPSLRVPLFLSLLLPFLLRASAESQPQISSSGNRLRRFLVLRESSKGSGVEKRRRKIDREKRAVVKETVQHALSAKVENSIPLYMYSEAMLHSAEATI